MRHANLPERFTRLGTGTDGREYIQCTHTGDVLVQTDTDVWSHFASAHEWRARTAAQLYPELIYLQRTLKRVGQLEHAEEQRRALNDALRMLGELERNVRGRIEALDAAAVPAAQGADA
jgi:hypothetical protein